MLTHQTTSLRTQFEYRKTRRIVYINRCIIQFFYLKVQLFPFIVFQTPALDLLARNLTYVHDQTVDKLDVTHFKREQSHRRVMVYRHILSHRKDKSRLTHRRTGGNDDKIGILPSGRHFVQSFETSAQTAQPFFLIGSLLKHNHRFLDDRIDLGNIFLHIALRNLKELSFRFLHKVFHIDRLIKSLALYHSSEGDQLTRQIFLGDDTGMIFDMGTTGHLTGQLGNIERATYLFQFASLLQLLSDGQHIHRTLADRQIYDSCINFLMCLLIETLRFQYFTNDGVSILFKHQST